MDLLRPVIETVRIYIHEDVPLLALEVELDEGCALTTAGMVTKARNHAM